MTDYNDGNWHGWNGGECPVHPESIVDVKFNEGTEYEGHEAEDWIWNGKLYRIIAFRVTKPYVEPPKPREFWINEYAWGFSDLHDNKAEANEYATKNRIRCIHVREVIEE